MSESAVEQDGIPVLPAEPSVMPNASDENNQLSESAKLDRKARVFEKTGKQASPAQIRDLRLLTKFVKDFDLDVKQREIDEYLGFKERTSRRLRKEKTRSELVAEGKIEKRNRTDKPRKSREHKSLEPDSEIKKSAEKPVQENPHTQTVATPVPNGYVEGWQDGIDTVFAFP